MTSQEKAIQLVDSFMDLSEEQEYDTPRYISKEMAIQCALIAVDEIIKANPTKLLADPYEFYSSKGYWEQVKQEIEKL